MDNPDAADLTCKCSSSTLSCASGATQCALGCIENAGVAQCAGYTPSNGATDQHLAGVTGAFDVGPSVNATVDSSTGEIKLGTVVRRAAGPGVVSGIGFYPIDQYVAVLAVTGVKLETGSRVRVTGSRALILWSAGDVEIAGVIDVSAGCANGTKSCPGPGGTAGSTASATSTGCGAGFDGIPDGSLTASGGGGGFGKSGGAYNTACSGEGPGGVACGSPALVPLHGGFGGGRGEQQSGGGGGGAIQISSKKAIKLVGGGIDAGGAGGTGRPFGDIEEGGGGGSGGGILLEALEVTLAGNAVLAANGGGGGGGCEGAGNGESPHGEDGRFDAMQAPPGGCLHSIGGGTGFGGKGGAGTFAAGNSDSCGGGGGGAVGRIRINTLPAGLSVLGVTYSPDPTFGFVTAN